MLGRRSTARPVPARALTAAGARVRGRQSGEELRRLVQPWQARALGYYDQIGEIHYAAQFYARMLSPLRLFAGRLDEQGEVVEIEDPASPADKVAVAALKRMQDPGGGTRGLLSQYGRLRFLIGEARMLVTTEDGVEQWEILSPMELRVNSDGRYSRFKAPGLNAEELVDPPDDAFEPLEDGQAVVYRIWQRHPAYSSLADSTMSAVLDICDELLILTRAIRSRAQSRLVSQGILMLSDSLTFVPLEPVGDEDPKADPFVDEFIAAMVTPITDPGTSAAAAPLLIRFPGEMDLDKIVRHIQVQDPTQLYPETGMRREAIDRLAIGLDMPPEELTGIADVNHWSAWAIDEKTWKAHGQPVAQGFVDDMTASWYQPTLRDMKIEDWRSYVIGYDAASVVNHPDRSKDAKDLWDKGAISLAALRDACGFDDEDIPPEADRAERIGILTRDSSLAWYGIPTVKAGGLETEPGVIESPGQPTVEAPTEGPPSEGPPVAPESVPGEVVGSANGRADANAARIAGACQLGLLRARELAGNRALSQAKRDRTFADELKDVPARSACATLGQERLRKLGFADTRVLVEGSDLLIRDALRVFRVPEESAVLIAEQMVRQAARTLLDPGPPELPPRFQSYVRGLIVA